MTYISSVGTYLPPWGEDRQRAIGPDHDAVTLAVAAGKMALPNPANVKQVVLVSRDLPLLDGGNAAALLAGLGLSPTTDVVERIGGACAALDAVQAATAGTLVVAADIGPAGAAAVLVDGDGPDVLELQPVARVTRSLPVRARTSAGAVYEYEDPRLLRERGLREALRQAGLHTKPVAVAGIGHSEAAAVCEGRPPTLPTLGASAPLFALAALDTEGDLLAVDQASVTASRIVRTRVPVHRDEPAPIGSFTATHTPGPEIPVSLASYDRAFVPKLTFSAAQCAQCGALSTPPRRMCLECRSQRPTTLVPLPRYATVYTTTTINVPIPSLHSPYSLVIAELDGVDVRVLAKVTGAKAGSVSIGDRGQLVFRRVATRSGVPDYGYSFLPDDEETDR